MTDIPLENESAEEAPKPKSRSRKKAIPPAQPSAETPAEEVPVEMAETTPHQPTPYEEVANSVAELEVEIRNSTTGSAETRSLAADALRLIRENVERMAAQAVEPVAKLIRENLSSDYLDPDFWKGIGMVLQYQAEEARSFIQRRLRGEYSVDAFGMDQEIVDLVRPFAAFLYRNWWRVTTEGLEHVPDDGRTLLLANHAGMLPWDGAMIATALLEEHPSARMTRVLYDNWISSTPVIAPLLAALGQAPAVINNAERLLEADQLVCAFPEGAAAGAKQIFRRYQLTTFSEGGFLAAALRTGATVVPVAVIGAEEAFPVVANIEPLARIFGLPTFPISPIFPWLGPINPLSLPTKWSIVFLPALDLSGYNASDAEQPGTMAVLNDQVRQALQAALDERVRTRSSVFW
jgi:1-acyl-sn-glycerol-3-phosphate acyltransferase